MAKHESKPRKRPLGVKPARDTIMKTVVNYIINGGDIEALVGADPQSKIELSQALTAVGYREASCRVLDR